MNQKEIYVLETKDKDYVYKKYNHVSISNCLMIEDDGDIYRNNRINFKKTYSDFIMTFGSQGNNRRSLSLSSELNNKEDMFRLLSKHADNTKPFLKGSVGSVCMHASNSLTADQTTMSMFVELIDNDIRIWLTGCSLPCVSLFKPHKFEVNGIIFKNEKDNDLYWYQREKFNRLLLNNLNDPRRFIKKTSTTSNGEIADEVTLSLDENLINEEAKYDGYYGIVTNLEDEAKDIIKVASGRWEIEECFRILKTDFKARPVYLQRDDRIKAHFLSCFVALFFLRVLEYKTKHKYTTNELLDTLRSYNLTKINEGYIPSYTRDKISDDLHSIFGFRTDYEITSPKKMRNIIKISKK